MNYLLRSSKPKRSIRSNILLFIILLSLILLFFTSFGQKTVKVLATPFWKASMGLQNLFSESISFLESKKSLIEQNQKLQQELSLKEKDLRFLSILEEENIELKNIKENTRGLDIVIASVILRPSKTPYDTLVIDSGKFAGIKEGDRVLADGNVFIGVVYEADDYVSKVRLYSSPENRVEVFIGDENVQREAVGMGAGNFRVDLPSEVKVDVEDTIKIPSITANIFGIVEKVNQRPADSFKTILFKSPINIQEIEYVEIVK